jgi:hypothetical protein
VPAPPRRPGIPAERRRARVQRVSAGKPRILGESGACGSHFRVRGPQRRETRAAAAGFRRSPKYHRLSTPKVYKAAMLAVQPPRIPRPGSTSENDNRRQKPASQLRPAYDRNGTQSRRSSVPKPFDPVPDVAVVEKSSVKPSAARGPSSWALRAPTPAFSTELRTLPSRNSAAIPRQVSHAP